MKIHKGDYWSNIERSVDALSDYTTRYIFTMLDEHVQIYNDKFNTSFHIFESKRKVDRQKRLVGKGKSWVANIKKAPHVQGRAVDYAEYKDKIWVWEDKELRKLHTWLKENFPLFKLLRTGGDFKNVSDLPHYEIKRKIWILYNK